MKKNILKVFQTNVFRMISALFATFFLPAFLSVDAYANIKLYQLYLSYIGFFHLGYCDGVYLKYGGMPLKDNKEDIDFDIKTMRTFQLCLSLVVVIFALLEKNFILLIFGFTIYPRNLRTLYEYIFQATGSFVEYSRVLNFHSAFTIVLYVILIFVLQKTNSSFYILGLCLVEIISLIVSEIVYDKRKQISFSLNFDLSRFSQNIGLGFFLMLGNFANTLFLSIDKWFVKGYMGMDNFAYYSFASQLLLAVSMFITPITTTLYNYLSKYRSKDFETNLFKHLVPISFILLSFSYIAEMIIILFIPQYKRSINTIYILFLAQVLLCLNSAVFVNLYKVYKKQKEFFKNLCIIIFLSIICNFISYKLIGGLTSFAYATLVCMIVMTLLNYIKFRYLKLDYKCLIMIFTIVFIYFFTHSFMPFYLGLTVYIASYIFLFYLLDREEFIYWLISLKNVFINVKSRSIF